jgi:hypothetical protein
MQGRLTVRSLAESAAPCVRKASRKTRHGPQERGTITHEEESVGGDDVEEDGPPDEPAGREQVDEQAADDAAYRRATERGGPGQNDTASEPQRPSR